MSALWVVRAFATLSKRLKERKEMQRCFVCMRVCVRVLYVRQTCQAD